jgi:crotonobetainyl-CoA:carnitine CoA-transferase CaiB-like acyl-CoA transferase
MPLYRVDEVANHPHLAARGSLATRKIAAFGDIQLPVLPFRYSNSEVGIDPKCAMLGEDNYEVLRKYLNYSQQQVDALLRERLLYEHTMLTQRRQAAAPGGR